MQICRDACSGRTACLSRVLSLRRHRKSKVEVDNSIIVRYAEEVFVAAKAQYNLLLMVSDLVDCLVLAYTCPTRVAIWWISPFMAMKTGLWTTLLSSHALLMASV